MTAGNRTRARAKVSTATTRGWLTLTCVCGALLAGCGSSQRHAAEPPGERSVEGAEPAPDAPADAGAPEASSSDAGAMSGTVAEPLPERVDGGEIPRSVLFAVLQGGVARFLQQVRAEPHLEQGRFIGWRVVGLFPSADSELHSNVVQPGDTVMRVNGQSIERPEQFKNVWDSMATSSELVLLVRRGQQQSTVRYQIVE